MVEGGRGRMGRDFMGGVRPPGWIHLADTTGEACGGAGEQASSCIIEYPVCFYLNATRTA